PRPGLELFRPVIGRADTELQLIPVQLVNAELPRLAPNEVDLSRALRSVQLERPFLAHQRELVAGKCELSALEPSGRRRLAVRLRGDDLPLALQGGVILLGRRILPLAAAGRYREQD